MLIETLLPLFFTSVYEYEGNKVLYEKLVLEVIGIEKKVCLKFLWLSPPLKTMLIHCDLLGKWYGEDIKVTGTKLIPM